MDIKEGFNTKKLVANVKQMKEVEFSKEAKISLIGIRRQKNGRYAAQITDRIRHKKVWLGTFDTVEQASAAYFSKKFEFENEKLTYQGNKKSKRIRETTRIVGVHKKNKRGKYNSEIKNPITKKRIWLGTFDTAEEASQAYQCKKLEFNAMQQQCTDKHTHSEQDGGSGIDVPISNSCNGGTDRRIDSHGIISTVEEGFRIAKEASSVFNSVLMANVYGEESSDECNTTTRCDPKAKISLIGIRRRKSGRYAAVITDPIKHKEVSLGTFHTIEEASQAYLSKKSEFEKLRQGNKQNKPKKNCDQIQQPESPSVVASFSLANDQTLGTASDSRGDKIIDSHKTPPRIIGAYKSKTAGRYTSEIINPITKKKIWLGTFDTAEEASHAYLSKKIEFQKLVKEKQQQCMQRKLEKLVNVKQGHKNVNCELKSSDESAEIDVTFSNSSNGGTDQSIDSDKTGAAEEAFHAYQSKKFDLHSSKKAELQSNMPTDSSCAGEKQEAGQEDDGDLWMGKWVQLPGDDTAVMFSPKLGLPIIDNYGYLLGEFSNLDDLSICKTEDDNQT